MSNFAISISMNKRMRTVFISIKDVVNLFFLQKGMSENRIMMGNRVALIMAFANWAFDNMNLKLMVLSNIWLRMQ